MPRINYLNFAKINIKLKYQIILILPYKCKLLLVHFKISFLIRILNKNKIKIKKNNHTII